MDTSDRSFKEFYLAPELLTTIYENNFTTPSQVQADTLASAIEGRDMLVQAKSGMGKTAVFVISSLQRYISDYEKHPFNGKVQILVIGHTHELAYQITKEFNRFTKNISLPHKCMTLVGKVPVATQEKLLAQNTDTPIAVGCPGRIMDLVERGALDLSDVHTLVFDECDKMINVPKMAEHLRTIYGKVRSARGNAPLQVMAFSATMFREAEKELTEQFMVNPLVNVIPDPNALRHGGLTHFVAHVSEGEKLAKLQHILRTVDFAQAIIFCRNPDKAELLQKIVSEELHTPSTFISAKLPEEQRMSRFLQFQNGEIKVLVSTGLFSRGIDVRTMNLVVNFDMPGAESPAKGTVISEDAIDKSANEYHHRVGRAGRFDSNGVCVSFIATENDERVLAAIQEKFKITPEEMPEIIDHSLYANN